MKRAPARAAMLGLAAGLLANQDFNGFVKVQKPEGQHHVVGRYDFSQALERLGIFAVHIEQKYMGLGVLLQNAPENECHGAGLAGAGGSQHCEMLAQHFIDLDHGRNRWVLLDVAHTNGGF